MVCAVSVRLLVKTSLQWRKITILNGFIISSLNFHFMAHIFKSMRLDAVNIGFFPVLPENLSD